MHVYLQADEELTPERRLLLQAILGSDRKREALGFLRIVEGTGFHSAFFETPEAKKENPVLWGEV